MSFQITNNASTTLAAGIASGATSLTVPSGKGALFPTPSGTAVFRATIVRASDNAVEIVECTARSTDTLTVTRAMEGTTALTLLTGDAIRLNMTAAVFGALTADNTSTASGKTTPVDADLVPLVDSAASNVIKQLTWANVKATLKTYFDTLYAALGSVNLFTKAQRGAFVTLTDGATITADLSLANMFNLVLGGNRTLGVPTNIVAGQQGAIVIYQDSSGTRTLAYAWIWGWAGGTAGVLTTVAGSRDFLAYSVDYYSQSVVTLTIATPCVITQTAHGFITGQTGQLTTTGALPTGLTASTKYYVHVIDANTFHLSTSLINSIGAAYINTSGSQSGTHTFTLGSITLSLSKAVA